MADVDADLVKRLAELVDGDGWEVADLLAERFPPEEYPEDSSGRNELHATLDAASDALRREHGVELKVDTMRTYRATSLAWPRGTRVPRASFAAHRGLRGDDGPDRMARYLKRNKGRPLSQRDIARYRADDNPKPPVPWEEAARKRLGAAVRSVLGQNPTAEAREVVAAILHELANEVRS
jgi:hypothetical protein